MRRIHAILPTVLFAASCGGPGTDEMGTPARMAFTVNTAFDFSSASYSIVDLDTLEVARDVLPVYADSVGVCAGGRLFVLERWGADDVTLIDRDFPFGVTGQHTVGAGGNPQGLVILPSGDALVTLLDRDYLLALDLGSGAEAGRVDLSWAADADGIPEACLVAMAGDRVAVALQRLDRDTPYWTPSGPGLIVLLDPATLEVVDADPTTADPDAIEMAAENPSPYGRMVASGGLLLVPLTGSYGALDGGIEAVDLVAMEGAGVVVGEDALGGDITDFLIVDGTTGWATVTTPEATDMLVRFDPSDGTVDPDPYLEGDGFTLMNMALDGDGRLLVVDRDLDDPGLVLLDSATGERISRVGTGLAPFSVCVP